MKFYMDYLKLIRIQLFTKLSIYDVLFLQWDLKKEHELFILNFCNKENHPE